MIRARRPFTALYYLHRVTALFPVCSGVIPRREMARHVFSFPPSPLPPSNSTRAAMSSLVARVPTTTDAAVRDRVDVPVLRVSRLFIIIIAIANLMSKPNATASAVFFYYRPRSVLHIARESARCYSPARGETRHVYGAFLLAQERTKRARARASRDFDFLTKSVYT